MELLYIDALPDGLDMQQVCVHRRGPWARDQTCFNFSRTKFVAAFNIYERTMMNEMGQVLWGSMIENTPQVQGVMHRHLAYCWEQPFANWLDDDCFAIKVDGGNQRYPIVAVSSEKGFQSVNGLCSLETRASQIREEDLLDNWVSSEIELSVQYR